MSHALLRLPPGRLDARSGERSQQMRAFLHDELAAGRFEPTCNCWGKGFSRDFSRRAGAAGLPGITGTNALSGQEGSPLERFVVIEALLAANAVRAEPHNQTREQ